MEIGRLALQFLTVLSWPLVVLVIALMFRRELRSVIGRLTRAELPGGVSFGFDYKTERLSTTESQERAALEQSALPSEVGTLPSPKVRPGEIPIDDVHGSEHAYTIEQIALTKLEQNLNRSIERSVRITKGEESLVQDGLIRQDSYGPDTIVEVKWFRNPSLVRVLVESLSAFEAMLKTYQRITGRSATLLLTLVVPERIHEVVEKLKPLKQALSGTDWRVVVLDYDDIGFSRAGHSL